MKQAKRPAAKSQSEVIEHRQANFNALYRDIPASECPDGSVTDAINVLLFGDYAMVRPGTRGWDAGRMPSISGRTNYSAAKSGYEITKTDGDDFTDEDLYRYFIWPDGTRDLIVEINSSTKVTVKSNTAHSAASGDGEIQARVNSYIWHEKSKKLFVHLGNKVYYTDYLINTYTEIYMNVGEEALPDSQSTMAEENEDIYLFTDRGHFKIDTRTTPYEMIQINTDVSQNTINPPADETIAPSSEETKFNRYGRRYIYSLSKLTGTGIRTRGDSGVRIQKETALNSIYESKDWQAIWRPIRNTTGNYSSTMALRRCKIEIGNDTEPLEKWKDFTDGGFRIDVDGIIRDVVFDLSDVQSWYEVADIISLALQGVFPEYEYVECFYDETNGYLTFISGDPSVDVGALSALTASLGTDMYINGYLNNAVTPQSFVDINGWFTMGTTDSNPALRTSGGVSGWTHYSIYSTLTLGAKWENTDGESTRDKELFVHQKDVRFCAAMYGSIDEYSVTLIRGEVEDADVGSMLELEDGSTAKIVAVYSSVSFEIDASFDITNESMAIGCSYPMRAHRDGVTGNVIKDGPAAPVFTIADIGKTIYWDDGTYSLITGWVSNTEVTVAESSTDTTVRGACYYNIVGRNYNDLILDDTLLDRAASDLYQAGHRWWIGLPDGSLGEKVPGFIFTAEDGAQEFYYSQVSQDKEYLAGHHYRPWQKHPTKDAIKLLKEFPDQLVVFCGSSTHRVQVNVTNILRIDEIGSVIAGISGLGALDMKIGLMGRGFFQNVEHGVAVIVTSEPGIRRFDGYQYSKNLAIDEQGRGHVQKDLNLLQADGATGYDGLFGFIMWGTDESLTDYDRVVSLNKSYRMAIDPEQGYGWAELNGEWVIPAPEMGVIRIFDDNDQLLSFVWDDSDGRPYLLATRTGPTDSNIVEEFTDKDRDWLGGSAGSEIPWSIKFKEFRANREEYVIRHIESHLFLRPQDESNQGASGYDVAGFRDAQELTLKVYKNGNETETDKTVDIPDRGNLVFDEIIEDNRIQLELSGTASELKLVGYDSDYEEKFQRKSPTQRNISEQQYQEEFAEPAFWITRGENLLLDRVTNTAPSGTITEAEGPDGYSNTALVVASANITYADYMTDYDPFTLVFNFYHTAACNLFTIGNYRFSINASNQLCVTVGIATTSIFNTFATSTWHSIAIYRNGNNWTFYFNGTLFYTIPIPGADGDGDFILYYNAANAPRLFDIRYLSGQISANAIAYYYRNITNNEGWALLPESAYTA